MQERWRKYYRRYLLIDKWFNPGDQWHQWYI